MSLKAVISTIISNTVVLAQFYPYKHLYYNLYYVKYILYNPINPYLQMTNN